MADNDHRQLRTTLGHYPTGVTIVTATAADGEPAGLTIGSFTSVSLSPPLVAFLPQRDSASFARIRSASSFCVNILAEDQESVCRAFASAQADRFGGVEWRSSPSGAPILSGAVAWLDCVINDVIEAGDHVIVVGEVREFSTERDRMPLLFFQGGYGSFQPLSLTAPSTDQLRSLLQTVDAARPAMERLAGDLGVGCLAVSVVNDEIITLASTARPDSHLVPAAVGQRVTWLPPLGAMFVAWAGDAAADSWLRRSRQPLDPEQRRGYLDALARVRTRGWSLALDSDVQREFEDAITDAGDGSAPDVRAGIEDLIGRLQPAYEPIDLSPDARYRVRHIGAPIFAADGTVVLDLHLFGLPPSLSTPEIERLIEATVTSADSVTDRIGGRKPVMTGSRP